MLEGDCSQNSPGCGVGAGKGQVPQETADHQGPSRFTWSDPIPLLYSARRGHGPLAPESWRYWAKGSWGPRGILPSSLPPSPRF